VAAIGPAMARSGRAKELQRRGDPGAGRPARGNSAQLAWRSRRHAQPLYRSSDRWHDRPMPLAAEPVSPVWTTAGFSMASFGSCDQVHRGAISPTWTWIRLAGGASRRSSWDAPPKVGFAMDSPLEGTGIRTLGPPQGNRCRHHPADCSGMFRCCGGARELESVLCAACLQARRGGRSSYAARCSSARRSQSLGACQGDVMGRQATSSQLHSASFVQP
jgi:hypothetical protein